MVVSSKLCNNEAAIANSCTDCLIPSGPQLYAYTAHGQNVLVRYFFCSSPTSIIVKKDTVDSLLVTGLPSLKLDVKKSTTGTRSMLRNHEWARCCVHMLMSRTLTTQINSIISSESSPHTTLC